MKRLLLVLALVATGVADASTLRLCAQGSPRSFDPANTDSGVDHTATIPIFDGLVETERGGSALIPALATGWTVSADGRNISFPLRRGVKFHRTAWFTPTRDFNADDVLFTFARWIDPQSPFQRAFPTISPYVTALGWDKLIRKVVRVNDYEVRVELASADASFLILLGYAFAAMQSAEYGEQLLKQGKPANIVQWPIGTGPFVFKSFQQDSLLRYTRNPDYFRRDVPLVDGLVYAITTDRNVRTQRLKRNECDIAVLSNPADVLALATDPQINLTSVPGLNTGFLAFNLKKPPLDKLEVRQALDMAIDKKAIIAIVYGASGELASSLIPTAQWAHRELSPNRDGVGR